MNTAPKINALLPPPLVVKVRIKEYAEKKWHEKIDELTQPHRCIVAGYLSGRMGFSDKEISDLLKISKSTIHRDIGLYEILLKRTSTAIKEIEKIHEYILYNAKWLRSY